MDIADNAIEEFIVLWEETYGERISKDQARDYAGQLLRLLSAAYGPR
jgi:hypothetical protein